MVNIIREYIDPKGENPYANWLASLRDKHAIARIIMHVDRMELGIFGDSAPIGRGLSELRIHYGPGYRVYFGKVAQGKYLLLSGGNKSTQSRDIKQVKRYWQEFKQRKQHGT